MLPTLLAMAGDTEVTDKLLKGYKNGDMTYKVHLDGYSSSILRKFLPGLMAYHPSRDAAPSPTLSDALNAGYRISMRGASVGTRTRPLRSDETSATSKARRAKGRIASSRMLPEN